MAGCRRFRWRGATYRTPGAPTPAAAVHKPHGQPGSWPSSSSRRRSTKLSVSSCPVACASWYTSIANLSLLPDERPTVSVCLDRVDDPVNDAPTAIGPPPKQDGGAAQAASGDVRVNSTKRRG